MRTLRQILQEYRQQKKALPSFNIDSFEIYQAVELAAAETNLPCLVQLSDGEDKFISAERLLILVQKARIDGLPIYMNMDHCTNPERMEKLTRLGIDMIHYDGSKIDYSANLATAKKIVSYLRSLNPDLLVEVEFNHINLVGSSISAESFTKPSQALEFMTATQADLLAVSIGNLHGVNLDQSEELALDLLNQIVSSLPSQFYYTLHGGSGIDPVCISAAIKSGIVKININTDLRLKFKHSLADSLSRQSTEKIYDYFIPVVEDLKQVIIQKLINFSNP